MLTSTAVKSGTTTHTTDNIRNGSLRVWSLSLVWVLGLMLPVPRTEAEEFHSYIGADLTYLTLDTHLPCRDELCHPGERIHYHLDLTFNQGVNFGFLYGNRFNRFFAAEADMLYVAAVGSTDISTVSNQNTDLTYALIPRLSARVDWPLSDDFKLFARYSVGGIFSQYHDSTRPFPDLNLSERFYGPSVGLEYFLSKRAWPHTGGLRLIAIPHTRGSETSFSAYSLGVVLRW